MTRASFLLSSRYAAATSHCVPIDGHLPVLFDSISSGALLVDTPPSGRPLGNMHPSQRDSRRQLHCTLAGSSKCLLLQTCYFALYIILLHQYMGLFLAHSLSAEADAASDRHMIHGASIQNALKWPLRIAIQVHILICTEQSSQLVVTTSAIK